HNLYVDPIGILARDSDISDLEEGLSRIRLIYKKQALPLNRGDFGKINLRRRFRRPPAESLRKKFFHVGRVEISAGGEDEIPRPVARFIEFYDIVASDGCKRFLVAAGWSAVGMIAVEIGAEIRTDHSLRFILVGFDLVYALLDHLCKLVLREDRIEQDVGDQIESFVRVLLEKLGCARSVIVTGVVVESSADEIELRRDLIGRARLCALSEQRCSQ